MLKLIIMMALGVAGLQSCATENGNRPADQTQINAQQGKEVTAQMTKDRFLKEVWNYRDSPDEWKFLGNKPVIIDFYADWCGPCKIASPILEDVAKEYQGKIQVYKIDTDKERELAGVFGIQSIPSFLYIPVNGKPVMMAGIGRSREETKKMFTDNIKNYLLKD